MTPPRRTAREYLTDLGLAALVIWDGLADATTAYLTRRK